MSPPNHGTKIISSTKEIVEYLTLAHKGLRLIDSNNIQGTLNFAMKMQAGGYQLIDPCINYSDLNIIQDQYKVWIKFNSTDIEFPKVWEIGGRIKKSLDHISKKLPKFQTITDLHVYEDGSLCLCTPTHFYLKYKNGISIQQFIEELVIPFFYYQSYLSTHSKEPYPGSGHGDLGILEYLADNRRQDQINSLTIKYLSQKTVDLIVKKRPSSKRLCICGSGKPGIICHRTAIIGAKILYKYLKYRY